MVFSWSVIIRECWDMLREQHWHQQVYLVL